MGSPNASILGANSAPMGSIGRGGTSNQTNASFQIGRARRSFRNDIAQNRQEFRDMPLAETMANRGPQASLLALEDYEDTPFGPQLTLQAAQRRRPGLMGNRARSLPQRSNDGGDRYIRMRFNEPNYSSRET